MPTNRHFWQGMEISWRGELIELNAFPHGWGVLLIDWNCGEEIKINPAHSVYLANGPADQPRGSAAAQFEITGRIEFDDGNFRLKPTAMRQLSPWITNAAFVPHMHARMRELRSRVPPAPLPVD